MGPPPRPALPRRSTWRGNGRCWQAVTCAVVGSGVLSRGGEVAASAPPHPPPTPPRADLAAAQIWRRCVFAGAALQGDGGRRRQGASMALTCAAVLRREGACWSEPKQQREDWLHRQPGTPPRETDVVFDGASDWIGLDRVTLALLSLGLQGRVCASVQCKVGMLLLRHRPLLWRHAAAVCMAGTSAGQLAACMTVRGRSFSAGVFLKRLVAAQHCGAPACAARPLAAGIGHSSTSCGPKTCGARWRHNGRMGPEA